MNHVVLAQKGGVPRDGAAGVGADRYLGGRRTVDGRASSPHRMSAAAGAMLPPAAPEGLLQPAELKMIIDNNHNDYNV